MSKKSKNNIFSLARLWNYIGTESEEIQESIDDYEPVPSFPEIQSNSKGVYFDAFRGVGFNEKWLLGPATPLEKQDGVYPMGVMHEALGHRFLTDTITSRIIRLISYKAWLTIEAYCSGKECYMTFWGKLTTRKMRNKLIVPLEKNLKTTVLAQLCMRAAEIKRRGDLVQEIFAIWSALYTARNPNAIEDEVDFSSIEQLMAYEQFKWQQRMKWLRLDSNYEEPTSMPVGWSTSEIEEAYLAAYAKSLGDKSFGEEFTTLYYRFKRIAEEVGYYRATSLAENALNYFEPTEMFKLILTMFESFPDEDVNDIPGIITERCSDPANNSLDVLAPILRDKTFHGLQVRAEDYKQFCSDDEYNLVTGDTHEHTGFHKWLCGPDHRILFDFSPQGVMFFIEGLPEAKVRAIFFESLRQQTTTGVGVQCPFWTGRECCRFRETLEGFWAHTQHCEGTTDHWRRRGCLE